MVSIFIPPGEFLMGSTESDKYATSDEKPQHKVTLDGYWMDKTEVTNAMYRKCVEVGSCKVPQDIQHYNIKHYNDPKYDQHPVGSVDWNQAKGYCAWVGGRLPTEAEWEKAARSTDRRIYPWGNDPPDSTLLNFNQNIYDTTAVGSYPKGVSRYGLLDMAGNALEWVNDWYDESYYKNSPQSNPQGPSSGRGRVLRGGSWYDEGSDVRTASRGCDFPDDHYYLSGFRCVRLP
jgi:formylglycine-generating enzyme required for sulfatase activity